jgi:hypothetical protein
MHEGSTNKAFELLRRIDSTHPWHRLWYEVIRGERQRALAIVAEMEKSPDASIADPVSLAMDYSYLGETDNAIALLERQYSTNPIRLLNISIDPFLNGLHSDTRFIALLKKIRLDERAIKGSASRESRDRAKRPVK